MKKASILMIAVVLCLLMLLSGCSSNSSVSVPKEELKGKAYSMIQSNYPNSSAIEFAGDSYNSEDQTYDMLYNLSSSSSHGYLKYYNTIRARSVYNPSSRTWSDIYLSQTDSETVPEVSFIGSISASSRYGGDVTVQLLSVDRNSKTIKANIDANNLTVKAENYIGRTEYTVNIHARNVEGTYQFTSGSWSGDEDYMIFLGNHDGQDIILSVRYLSTFGYDEPSYILYVGMDNNLLESGCINLY